MENGYYTARAVQWGLGKAGTGNQQIAVEFQLEGNETSDGERITWHGYFTDKTLERTVESLRHCGWNGDDLSDLQGMGDNLVMLVIEQQEYEGKWYPRVKWVNSPTAGIALKAPLAENEAKSFAASMKGRIAALRAKQGQPRQQAKPASRVGGVLSPEPPPYGSGNGPDNLDDIPF